MVDENENKVEDKKEDSGESTPIEFEFMGKKFDLSTERGRIEAQAWSEAFGKMHGKQTNELGELRKFHKRLAPATDEKEIINRVKQLKEDGDMDQVAELLLANQRGLKAELLDELKKDRANEKAWKQYFNKRKTLLEQFDEDYVRDFSEKNLGIYESDSPYDLLDSYWVPKLKAQKEFSSGDPVDSYDVRDVRSAQKVSIKKQEKAEEEPDLNNILDDIRKKALSSK